MKMSNVIPAKAGIYGVNSSGDLARQIPDLPAGRLKHSGMTTSVNG